MAKQKGIVKLEGTLGDITFFRTEDGYIARENNAVSGSRIATDPAFQRTRENNAEFGRAGKAGKVLRNAVRPLMQNAKDKKVASRLTAAMMKVVKADLTSKRGMRNVIDGEAELLQGFDFNVNAVLGASFYAPYTVDINRVTGILSVSIPSFIPANRIVVPGGTTHFKIVTMGAEVDFANETFITDAKESPVLPWDDTATVAMSLDNAVTQNSTHPLFLLVGIQFFQQVAGVNCPLKSGAFNALSLVKVSGA